jgi:hypothetical protein
MGAILAAIVLIFVIPIVINEIYKSNTGYVTMWKASDVLSYYGTILGACVTICSLAATILFTKRQIQRDSYLKFQEEKWGNIEAHISKAVEDIHPTKLSIIISQAVSNRNAETIAAIDRYSLQAKITLDSLFGFISGEDMGKEPDSVFETIKSYVIDERFARQINGQICEGAVAEIKYKLMCAEISKKNDGEAKASLNAVLAEIDYETIKQEQENKFQAVLQNRSYADIIKVFNKKSVVSSIGHFLGINDKEYDIRCTVRFKQAVELVRGKTAVSPGKEGCFGVIPLVFLQKRQHKRSRALAAILCSRTKLDLQQISSQAIEAKQWMIPMCLIMVVEGFALLRAIGSQQSGIQIEQNMLWLFDGVNSSAENPLNLLQLLQALRVHAVVKTGQSGLGSQSVFTNDSIQDGIVSQAVGVIILKIGTRNLIEHLQKVLVILVDSERS